MNENNDVLWRMPSGKRVYPEQAEHSQRELNGSRVEFALAQLNVEFHRAA